MLFGSSFLLAKVPIRSPSDSKLGPHRVPILEKLGPCGIWEQCNTHSTSHPINPSSEPTKPFEVTREHRLDAAYPIQFSFRFTGSGWATLKLTSQCCKRQVGQAAWSIEGEEMSRALYQLLSIRKSEIVQCTRVQVIWIKKTPTWCNWYVVQFWCAQVTSEKFLFPSCCRDFWWVAWGCRGLSEEAGSIPGAAQWAAGGGSHQPHLVRLTWSDGLWRKLRLKVPLDIAAQLTRWLLLLPTVLHTITNNWLQFQVMICVGVI